MDIQVKGLDVIPVDCFPQQSVGSTDPHTHFFSPQTSQQTALKELVLGLGFALGPGG